MSKPHAHDNLAPVLFDYVPRGRTAQDRVLYKMLRWHARRNRQQIYETTMDAWRNLFLFGTATIKVKWNGDLDR
jgi:hypothetical protein